MIRNMEDKIRVLMIGPDRSVHGGISALVNSYYEAGLDKKVELKYIGTMKEGSRLKKLFVAACALIRFSVCVNSCDIVHANFSSDSSFMRKSLFIRIAKRRGKKIILHQHGGDFRNYYRNELDGRGRKYVKKILGMGDVMLVLTKSWKEFFSRLTDPDKIYVLPNGVVTKNVKVYEKGDPKDMNSILFLGRICVDKGINELIGAVEKLHRENSSVRLYMGGIFEDDKLREIIEKNSGFIKYIGWVSGDEKEKMLRKCGMLALPSYFEGLPVTLIEGMLHGCCVVASKVGGIPDIVEDGEDGILIEPKSTQALKNGLERVMKDAELADKLSCNGVKKALGKYSIEKLSEDLIGFYKKVCND
ncbi:MAG: glycosyltransferase family 4 protein [Butyrivibrio sp.]|nr:glycosyltransferase family 4 protein [Butyrivibrio sp.]